MKERKSIQITIHNTLINHFFLPKKKRRSHPRSNLVTWMDTKVDNLPRFSLTMWLGGRNPWTWPKTTPISGVLRLMTWPATGHRLTTMATISTGDPREGEVLRVWHGDPCRKPPRGASLSDHVQNKHRPGQARVRARDTAVFAMLMHTVCCLGTLDSNSCGGRLTSAPRHIAPKRVGPALGPRFSDPQ